MNVYVTWAEHPNIPSAQLHVAATMEIADQAAAHIANIIRQDAIVKVHLRPEDVPQATPERWQRTMAPLQEYYGAQHCWVEIQQCGVAYPVGHISDADVVTAQAARIRNLTSENVALLRLLEVAASAHMAVTQTEAETLPPEERHRPNWVIEVRKLLADLYANEQKRS